MTRLNTTARCGLGFALLELASGSGGLSVAGSIFDCVSFFGRLEHAAVVSEDDGGASRNFTRAGFDCDGMASHSFDFKAPLISDKSQTLRPAVSGPRAHLILGVERRAILDQLLDQQLRDLRVAFTQGEVQRRVAILRRVRRARAAARGPRAHLILVVERRALLDQQPRDLRVAFH